MYINIEENAPYKFKIGKETHFIKNEASKVGRDIFVYCENIFDLNPGIRFLFDISEETYN